jgi:WD40 repeat protein
MQIGFRDKYALLPIIRAECETPTYLQALVGSDFRDSNREHWNIESSRLRAILNQNVGSELDLECPYPGIRSFVETDSHRFFGRKTELDDIIGRMRHGEREIYLVGPSGSGKSSLVAAGLLPRLGSHFGKVWTQIVRPGDRPFSALKHVLQGASDDLGEAVNAILRRSGSSMILLVIDQLEELFSGSESDEKRMFVRAIGVLRLDVRFFVLFTLRADFYALFMNSELWTGHSGTVSRIEVGPLRREELRQVIEQPARASGVYLEPGLVERLLNDAAAEPGALPLLQETLVQLWNRRRRRFLALADYEAMGDGVRNGLALALAARADTALRGLTLTQERVALRIMLRLVAFGEGRADTRRQQSTPALRSVAESSDVFDIVLQQLVDDRLVMVTSGYEQTAAYIDLAHEVIIHAWPTFATWIKTWRAYEKHRRQLEEAASGWISRGRSEGGLLDEVELASTLAWREQAACQLGETSDMMSFVQASQTARTRAILQRSRRFRLAFGALIGFLAVVSSLGLVARSERVRTEEALTFAQSQHVRAETALVSAENRKHELVLLQAETALAKDPTATLAWLKSHDIKNEERTRVVDIVDEALALNVARHVFRPGDWVLEALWTPDGKGLVAAARDGTIWHYDLASGAEAKLGRAPSSPYALVLTADGEFAITGSLQGEVISWPMRGGMPRLLVDNDGRSISRLELSHDGCKVMIEYYSGAPQLVPLAGGSPTTPVSSAGVRFAVAADDWSHVVAATTDDKVVAPGAQDDDDHARVLSRFRRTISFLAISPRGDTVVVHDGTTIWSLPFIGGPRRELVRYADRVWAVAWSPDGRTLAIGGHRHEIIVVDLAIGSTTELRGHSDAIYGLEFTRNGEQLLSASDDATARLWTLATRTAVVLRGHDDDVFRAHISPDGREVVTASLDGSVRVWQIEPSKVAVYVEHAPIEGMRLDGDDLSILTRASVAHWNIATGKRELVASQAEGSPTHGFVPMSNDRENVVVLSTVDSLELRTHGRPPIMLRGHRGLVTHVEFSRDGRLYSSSVDGTLRRWDSVAGSGAILLHAAMPLRGFAVARDGRILAYTAGATYLIDAAGSATKLGMGGIWCVDIAEFEPVTDRLILRRCDNHLAIVESGRQIDLSTGGYRACRVAVSPDGSRIAAGLVDRTIRLWSTQTGALLDVLHGPADLPLDVAFSPDGKLLASATWDKTIWLWNLATKHHRVLRGHTAEVVRVVWRDGGRLVSGSADGTIRLWDVPNMEPSISDIVGQLEEATTAQIVDDRPASSYSGLDQVWP